MFFYGHDYNYLALLRNLNFNMLFNLYLYCRKLSHFLIKKAGQSASATSYNPTSPTSPKAHEPFLSFWYFQR